MPLSPITTTPPVWGVGEPGRTDVQLRGVVRAFIGGDQRSSEGKFELARRSGTPTVALYQALVNSLSAVVAAEGNGSFAALELDEQLERLVARFSPGMARNQVPQCCVVSTQGFGTSACIAHLLTDLGVSTQILHADSGGWVETGELHAAGPRSAVRLVVIDGARSDIESVLPLITQLRQDRSVSDLSTEFVLLAEHGFCVPLPADPAALNGVIRVENLADLLNNIGMLNESPLTLREMQVLSQVANGRTNAQVATSLGVGVSTVKTYLERIQARLKSSDRTSAVAIAIRRGWI